MRVTALMRLELRRREIVRQLAELSYKGWANAKPEDYVPLERELTEITNEIARRSARENGVYNV